tara:strand:+ start:6219 stop:6998 length:780 start_codon:yes stop_codon:yes gene_type:complete
MTEPIKNISSLYSTKGISEIKDMDNDKRQVAIYLSKFDNIDSDNDIIRKGAFKKSLKERGVNSKSNRKIQFLRYHDWEHQIGTFETLEEDDKGLFAVANLGTSTKGEDAWRDYQEGIILEHSIGFQYIESKIKWIKDETLDSQGFFEIKEVKLFEGSAVTFGSNEMANTIEIIKSENKEDAIDEISERLGQVIKSLSIGQGSDNRLHELEMKAKFLSSQLGILAKSEPFIKNTPTIVKPFEAKEKSFDWDFVISGINKL